MLGIRRLALSLTAFLLVGLALAWAIASAPPPAWSGQAAGQWSLEGCIRLQNSQVCRDVFADGSGNLWLCDGCGRTKNPSPGKCRKLTADEIAAATWCNGGS